MEDGPPRFPRGSTCPAVLRWPLIKTAQFRIRDCHPLRSGFPARFCCQAVFSNFTVALPRHHSGTCNPSQKTAVTYRIWRFRLVPVRSPLLGESRLISFPPVTEMFHFTGLSAYDYVFIIRSESFITRWLPHSDIFGSKLTRSSPKLFAACHVLHRRLPPRHPPCALNNFNPKFHISDRVIPDEFHLATPALPACAGIKSGVRILMYPTQRNCFRFL